MYYKKVNYNSNKECFEFLTNHFSYYTMNSWNGLRSIANNVKIYNLSGIDLTEALEALEEDNYLSVNDTIRWWEEDHPGYRVGFNGRSQGYLVLYNPDNNGHCFEGIANTPCEYDNYESWKEDVQEDWGSLKEYHEVLVRQVKVVQDFDKLCDDLVEVLKALIKDIKHQKELTRSYSATLRFQRYYYDTVEDMRLHMIDMKRRGYSVWESSDSEEEGIYAEYEMNESIHSEIILEEGEE